MKLGFIYSSLVLLMVIYRPAESKTLFVGIDGSNSNPGSLDLPYQTLQFAVNTLTPGDTLFILEGTYRQQIKKNYLRGQEGNNIVISAYPGHKVVIDGTVDIISDWELHEGSIFRTVLDTAIWQLFLDDKMMTSARWPNADAWSSDMWDTEKTWGWQAEGSTYGHFIDDGRMKLAGSGIDFTGAIAIMNMGSWLSFAEKVDAHGAGENDFTYTPHFRESQYHQNIKHGRYFFEAAMVCLDAPNEWYFNPDTRELFLYADNGADPSGRNIKGKTLTYAFDFIEARYLEIRDLDFFGCAVRLENTRYSSLENCDFLYPSYSRRMLGSIQYAQPNLVSGGSISTISRNRVVNCTFEKSDGSGLKIVGSQDLIENCYFHNIDYSCVGGLNDNAVAAESTNDITFRYNTIDSSGNSLGIKIRESCLVEFNRVSNIGFLQHDGSAIQSSSNDLCEVLFRRNWISDCIKAALRFDTPWTKPEIYGKYGTMKYNVAWRSRPPVPKGDYNTISNNTAFDNGDFDISIFSDVNHGGVNTHTITRNNAVNAFSGNNIWGITPISGIHDHNWEGIKFTPKRDIKDQLYDVANLDFRPRPGSELVDAGLYQEGITEGYVGMAPDIGAYEFGDSVYWMAGRRFPKASSPIPADKGTSNYEFVDLIWMPGYRCDSFDIYLGNTESELSEATRMSLAYKGCQATNIFNPGPLSGGEVYFWRIDAHSSVGTEKGDVWSFTAGANANPPVYRVDFLVYAMKDSVISFMDSALVQLDERKSETRADGRTAITMVKGGEYALSLSRKAYVSSPGKVKIYSDTLLCDTMVYTTHKLKVLVHDKNNGLAVGGCLVRFDGTWYNADSSGVVQLDKVEHGSYRIEVSSEAHEPLEERLVDVFADTTFILELDEKLFVLDLLVTEKVTGTPLQRALIGMGDVLKVTNSSGEVRIGDLKAGSWAIRITHNDYFELVYSFQLFADTSVIIEMTPVLADMRFEIRNSLGPLAGATVVLNDVLRQVSDNDGVAKFINRQSRREHSYKVSKDGYGDLEGSLNLELDSVIQVFMEEASGIELNHHDLKFRLFPNPADQQLSLVTDCDRALLRILTLDGKICKSQQVWRGVNEVDLSGLSEGIWIFQLQNKDVNKYLKIVISR